ncbi:MAG: tRNA (adenosine(37)-N6)-threonylcarbamoyltransferase complex transferase subunit TsaD [bacterium]
MAVTMKILAIETSCDETSAAVVKSGKEILSNIVASQVDLHKKYGGIVPEVASRKHIEVIAAVVKQALDDAKIPLKKIDAVAGTYGPGLVGSLIVGLNYAKALAYALKKPFIAVNHIEGHIYANFLSTSNIQLPTSKQISNPKSQIPKFPFVCLVVSGGHTQLVLVKDHGKYETLGRTRDDAAGEAFDKVARFLGIGYPGGPIIDEMSKKGDPKAINFPRAMMNEGYDFSFSGLKTAVVNYAKKRSPNYQQRTTKRASGPTNELRIPDIVASFQQAAVDILVEKTIKAAKNRNVRWIALAGGVSANSRLREDLRKRSKEEGFKISIPPMKFCTDNAAMVGSAAYYLIKKGEKSNLDVEAVSTLRI